MQQPYRVTAPGADEFCSAKCEQEKKGQRGGGGATTQQVAGAAALIVCLAYVAVGIVKMIRWIAPRIGRESLIGLRNFQIQKVKSLELRAAYLQLGKAMHSGPTQDMGSRSKSIVNHIEALSNELAGLDEGAESKSMRQAATEKGKTLLLKQKLSAAYCELGKAGFEDSGELVRSALPKQYQRVFDIRSKCEKLEMEINELKVRRTANFATTQEMPEPEYNEFVPPVDWKFQCPRCGARVQHQIDVCWNCRYGEDGYNGDYVETLGG